MEVLEGEVTSHEDVTRGRIRVTSANEQAILTAVDRIETLPLFTLTTGGLQ